MLPNRKTPNQSTLAETVHALRQAALPLDTPEDLDPLLEAIGDARYVFLGEASHGTHEFYRWRAELSKRLIEEKQFSFIGVEGDWPDCYRVNRFVKRYSNAGKSAEEVLHAFDRWPTWMWANREIVEFVEWLHDSNRHRSAERKVGFYGLDVYSLWESMAAVVNYLDKVDPTLARTARRAYSCFEPYHEDVQEYAHATAIVPTSCENEVIAVLQAIRGQAPHYRDDREAYFNAEQNALVTRGAELYYRTMVRGGPTAWNVRDHHMMDTLERLMEHHGDPAKAIIWAHNTHVGDARFTDMARNGMVNIGQLARRAHGESPTERDGVVLVGFATHHGTVIASDEWGADMRRMPVPDASEGSLEDLLHRAGVESTPAGEHSVDGLFLFSTEKSMTIPGLGDPLGHRAIGVVYDPSVERYGNYVPTIIPGRYDALFFLDHTRALEPLHMPVMIDGEIPETYPTGM